MKRVVSLINLRKKEWKLENHSFLLCKKAKKIMKHKKILTCNITSNIICVNRGCQLFTEPAQICRYGIYTSNETSECYVK